MSNSGTSKIEKVAVYSETAHANLGETPKLLKVRTPKRTVTKEIKMTGVDGKFKSSQAFAELNSNKIKAERLAKIDNIKAVIAKEGISGYLKTHSVEAVIKGLSEEVAFIKDMIGSR